NNKVESTTESEFSSPSSSSPSPASSPSTTTASATISPSSSDHWHTEAGSLEHALQDKTSANSSDIGNIEANESQSTETGLPNRNTTEKANLVLIQQPLGPLKATASASGVGGGDESNVTTTITTAANSEVLSTAAASGGLISSKVPSISIFPLPATTTVRSISTANKATSPPLAFITSTAGAKTTTLVRSVPSLVLQSQRPQQQHQYQQTDKCTILKFDVVRKSTNLLSSSTATSSASVTPHAVAVTASSSSSATALGSETTLVIPSSAVHITNQQDLDELDDLSQRQQLQQQQHQQQSHIISNQPIIVKIEPTQAFHIVDENDTRVLSLPLTDSDKVGASWIDLKDIAGLQTASGTTLLDVCFEPVPPLTATSNSSVTTVSPMTVDIPTDILVKRQTVSKAILSSASAGSASPGPVSAPTSSAVALATKAVSTVTSVASTSRESSYTAGHSTSGAMTVKKRKKRSFGNILNFL
ncbi:mucin-5AC-like, partial [Stomoxys calcitrans]|uniref:mucin-5AC-like n=1 Tax=Stomoxys calcitrans TaxID=35570 RepID=UPI0027E39C92